MMRKPILAIVVLFMLAAPATAHVPECYGPHEFSGTYTTSMLQDIIWAMVQELNEAERKQWRTHERIASLIGPCLLSDGTIHHMVDRRSEGR